MEHAMKPQIALCAILGAAAAGAHAQAAQKFQKLTGAQIQTKFTGMELTDESHWGEVFERGGCYEVWVSGKMWS
jgi:hypothetical protein